MALELIIPIAILAGLGALLGVGLAVASKKFAVNRPAQTEDILALLPGANCGGCGFAGCAALAEAVCRGEANFTACAVVSRENAERAGQILGVSFERQLERHAHVLCSGGHGISLDRYNYEGLQDCRSAITVQGGPKLCEYGCLGFGTCVKICPFDAIHITPEGVARVDTTKCTGCGKCAEVCPKQCIALIDETSTYYIACMNAHKLKEVTNVCHAGCIGCGRCMKACEHGAITLRNNIPIFDHGKCVDCGKCAEVCPVHIIDRKGREEW